MKTQWSRIRGVTFFSGSLAVLLITMVVAQAQDEKKASAASLKMTCTKHGDAAMTLIGVKEDGTGGRTRS